jgi:ATP-dependent helicase/nuclease subunit A
VERIKRLIMDEREPVRLDRMLVVTFTEAAAAEMRQKIIDAISAELEQKDVPFLREQLQRIFTASISTFHAFALGILKRYYYIIDMEPSFRICDEFRKELLVNEALDTLFDGYFEREDSDPAFIDFLNRYAGSKNENSVREMIAHTHAFVQSLPAPLDWLERQTEALSMDVEAFRNSDAFRSLCAEIAGDLEAAASITGHLERYLDEAGVPSLARKTGEDLAQMRMLLAMAGEGAHDDFDALGEQINGFAFTRFVCTKADKENYECVRDIVAAKRNRAKGRLKKLGERFFAKPLADMVREINDTSGSARKLLELVRGFDEIFTEIKRREGLIDFNDIEHMALKILEDERVRREYREKFDYIFIDEYQDNNLIQEALISKIKREDNLFMVGDVKQSIYKFRLAEPEIFIGKYNDVFTDAEGATDRRIDLNRNFRSKGSILDNVNAIFGRLMERKLSGIAYDEKAALYRGLTYDKSWDNPVALCLVDTNRDIEDEQIDPEILELRDAELEALAAAREIRNAVEAGTKFFDTKAGVQRPLRYRDIVILLGEVRNTGAAYYETLMGENIPAFVDSGEGYFDAIEIETFVNLLRVIDNLRQDVALVSAIYSPVFGFTSEDLIRIRLAQRGGPFCAAFLAYAREGAEASLQKRCASALEKIEGWRRDEMFMELSDFLWKLMKESGYYDYAGALPGGTQRRANLRALVDRAAEFQTERIRGLFGFIGYIDSIKSKKVAMGQVKLLSEGDDVVRIMSIHKSKGLEFPMVIAGQMARGLGGGRDRGRVSLHKDIGVALQWESYETRSYKKTLLQRMVAHRKSREERAESIRVLYVAMTRAMDRLVLLGTAKNAADLVENADMLEPDVDVDVMNARSYLDMILPVLRESGTKTTVLTVSDLQRAHGEERAAAAEAVEAMLTALDAESRGEAYAEIERRLTYRYPFAGALSVKSKYSVSELNRAAHPAMYFIEGSVDETLEDAGLLTSERDSIDAEIADIPHERSDVHVNRKSLSAAERGSALHRAFEKLNYTDALAHRDETSYFDAFLDELAQKQFLTEEQRQAVPAAALQRYANTEVFARAAASDRLRREVPFNLKWKKDGEPIIVQGIVDCFFSEGGKTVLIDFKSNRINPNRPDAYEQIAALYSEQINLYREALETILSTTVEEAYLYLTNVGKTVEISRENIIPKA